MNAKFSNDSTGFQANGVIVQGCQPWRKWSDTDVGMLGKVVETMGLFKFSSLLNPKYFLGIQYNALRVSNTKGLNLGVNTDYDLPLAFQDYLGLFLGNSSTSRYK